MVPPGVMIKDGMGGRRFSGSFSWSAATERLVNAIPVWIALVVADLLFSGSDSASDRRPGFSLEDRLVASFRERSYHGSASLGKSAGAIREHSSAYLCIDLRSDRNLRLCVVAP